MDGWIDPYSRARWNCAVDAQLQVQMLFGSDFLKGVVELNHYTIGSLFLIYNGSISDL